MTRPLYVKPNYTKSQIDKAGSMLADSIQPLNSDEINQRYEVVNNWRASHGLPLVALRIQLENFAREINTSYLVSQRIKRLSSIADKLQRFKTMRLSQMQDLGGCRAVMQNVDEVYKLYGAFCKSRMRHKRIGVDDYIKSPRMSGYRGIHIIYRYNSNKNAAYNDLLIEIQLRSKLQHIWATAVETASIIVKQPLKSNIGNKDWLRFFSLMGSAIALEEKTSLVPKTPNDKTVLLEELRALGVKLDVENSLELYAITIKETLSGIKVGRFYYLIILTPSAGSVAIKAFRKNELETATKEYLDAERNLVSGANAVLVSVDRSAELRRAYPNYFLDTKEFIKEYKKIIKG